jgi:hypothetical protein
MQNHVTCLRETLCGPDFSADRNGRRGKPRKPLQAMPPIFAVAPMVDR